MSLLPAESRSFPDLLGEEHGYAKSGRRKRPSATLKPKPPRLSLPGQPADEEEMPQAPAQEKSAPKNIGRELEAEAVVGEPVEAPVSPPPLPQAKEVEAPKFDGPFATLAAVSQPKVSVPQISVPPPLPEPVPEQSPTVDEEPLEPLGKRERAQTPLRIVPRLNGPRIRKTFELGSERTAFPVRAALPPLPQRSVLQMRARIKDQPNEEPPAPTEISPQLHSESPIAPEFSNGALAEPHLDNPEPSFEESGPVELPQIVPWAHVPPVEEPPPLPPAEPMITPEEPPPAFNFQDFFQASTPAPVTPPAEEPAPFPLAPTPEPLTNGNANAGAEPEEPPVAISFGQNFLSMFQQMAEIQQKNSPPPPEPPPLQKEEIVVSPNEQNSWQPWIPAEPAPPSPAIFPTDVEVAPAPAPIQTPLPPSQRRRQAPLRTPQPAPPAPASDPISRRERVMPQPIPWWEAIQRPELAEEAEPPVPEPAAASAQAAGPVRPTPIPWWEFRQTPAPPENEPPPVAPLAPRRKPVEPAPVAPRAKRPRTAEEAPRSRVPIMQPPPPPEPPTAYVPLALRQTRPGTPSPAQSRPLHSMPAMAQPRPQQPPRAWRGAPQQRDLSWGKQAFTQISGREPQRFRYSKLVRFAVAEITAVVLLVLFLVLGARSHGVPDLTDVAIKVFAIILAVAAAVIPIVFYGLPERLPKNER